MTNAVKQETKEGMQFPIKNGMHVQVVANNKSILEQKLARG